MGQRTRKSTASGGRGGSDGGLIPLRSDALFKHKRLNIWIDKNAYIKLRTTLFRYDISIQEIFEDFALLLLSDTDRGNAILKRFAKQKMQRKIDGQEKPERKVFSEQDVDALYDLIAEDEGEETLGEDNEDDE